jgi:hypothetical protein
VVALFGGRAWRRPTRTLARTMYGRPTEPRPESGPPACVSHIVYWPTQRSFLSPQLTRLTRNGDIKLAGAHNPTQLGPGRARVALEPDPGCARSNHQSGCDAAADGGGLDATPLRATRKTSDARNSWVGSSSPMPWAERALPLTASDAAYRCGGPKFGSAARSPS